MSGRTRSGQGVRPAAILRYSNYVTFEATRPPLSRPDERRALGRSAAWLAKQVEIGLAAADLSLPQYRVLGLLDESPAVSSDLAERLAVRPPSVTAIVDGLVARGLVERRTVVADRRRVDHVLTDPGRRALDLADTTVADRLGEIVSCLGDESDRRQACDGLLMWRRALLSYRRARSGTR